MTTCTPSNSHKPRICRNGHIVAGDNAFLEKRTATLQCRLCRNSSLRRRRKNPNVGISEKIARRVLEALRNGQTLRLITRGYSGSVKDHQSGGWKARYVPSSIICKPEHLRNFCKANKAFGDLVAKLSKENARRSHLEGIRRRRTQIAAPIRDEAGGLRASKAVADATRNVWEAIRADVQGDMLLAIAEGRLHPRDAGSRVGEFVRAANRAERHSVLSKFGNASLDAPIFDDANTTLCDTVSQGLWSD